MAHRVLVFATYHHPPIYTVSNYFVPHLRRLPSNPVHPGRCANSSVRCWRCLPVAQLPRTGTRTRPHDWYSETRRTWRSWGLSLSLSLSLRIGPWPFRGSLRWLESVKLASGVEDIGSNEQPAATLNYHDACLLWNSAGEEKFFVPAGFSAWYLQVTFRDSCLPIRAVGHWRRWSTWPPSAQEGLPPPRTVIFDIFSVNIGKYKYLFCLGHNRFSGTILPTLTLRLWENLSWHTLCTSYRLTSPFSEPHTT